MQLVIGNKNYSSWSLRPWLLLTEFNLHFEETWESVSRVRIKERLSKYSPTNKVPVLIDGKNCIWDSLAICEYISEKHLHNKGWPQEMDTRAQARAICAEMHAGFNALRHEMPMNCGATRTIQPTAAARADIERIDAIWSYYPREYSSQGPWLFGTFSIADCMFAPVVVRFRTYGVDLSADARRYADGVINNAGVGKWVSAAKLETEIVPENEAGTEQ